MYAVEHQDSSNFPKAILVKIPGCTITTFPPALLCAVFREERLHPKHHY